MSELIPIAMPLRDFTGHEGYVNAIAVFPDKRRMVTGSNDKTLHMWDMKTGVVLKKMEGHSSGVRELAVSRDGQLIASGDHCGEVIVWHGETGDLLTRIEVHSLRITSLDFSPDGTVLATASYDGMKLWNTNTWQLQGSPIKCGDVSRVRYSPSGGLLAIVVTVSDNIQIYNSGTRERVASFNCKPYRSYNWSLTSCAWTPDGTRLLTCGCGDYPVHRGSSACNIDSTIYEWDTTTWQQVGDPWTGHSNHINAITIDPTGTLVASASDDDHVRLWRLSDRQTIAIFKHSSFVTCVTFSMSGNRILSDGDYKILEWEIPQGIGSKILSMTTARYACIDGDLSTAEELLTQEIDANANNFTSYAHRSVVMARKYDWDHALQDANKSISIQPSLIGYISKGIALCGQGRVSDASAVFGDASMYTHEDSQILHFLLLIKVIALFNANEHDEANLLLKELTTGCPNADNCACHIVEAYLRVQLGIRALDGAHRNEAAGHFTAAINSSVLSSELDIHEIYGDLVVLFGWDLKSLWLVAHQKCCHALLWAEKLQDAVKLYQYMMASSDENTKADCLDWSNDFKQECSALCVVNGDAALAASDHNRAIDLYSAAIDLGFALDVVFASRSKAKSVKMLWEQALLDAQKVTELNPSSHIGYELTYTALHGAQRYDEAIEAIRVMWSKLDDAPEAQIRDLRHQYVCLSEAEDAIRRAVRNELSNAPLRLLNTSTGLLCNRAAQLDSFRTSAEYRKLLSFTTKQLDMERIEEVVAMYFRCVLLSHRWEETEALLHDIKDNVVYELNELDGITKLQSFCKVARDAGYRWAWIDTCCIDKSNNVELQESVNSMFVWYRHSALAIVYLSDVSPSSHPGALARSVWNERGWTFQEFVAPKVVIFYQNDWSLYLDDRSPNHKESPTIMEELEGATGIDARALTSFRPGMRGAREKLQWASRRVTTMQEDIAYSLFGIFGVHLPVIYGERKQNALGRLLQEIVARSGDITALDWVGQSSEFNSCLPADIISYATPPSSLPSLSEDEIQTAVSSLRNIVAVDSASKLYNLLEDMNTPLFANCRLRLPCIAFRVTEVKRRPGHAAHSTYGVKADGLRDLLIATDETLIQFSRTRPTRRTFFLIRPWDRRLLELPDFADEAESVGDLSESESASGDTDESFSESPGEEDSSVDSESHSRSLRLMVHLGQAFSALLLAQQRVGEYKRIASDYNIIAQVKDTVSIDIMNIRTLDIL